MRKRNFVRSAVLYVIFLSDTAYSIRNGFTWPYWIVAALTAAILILDITEVITHARD